MTTSARAEGVCGLVSRPGFGLLSDFCRLPRSEAVLGKDGFEGIDY